MGIALAAALCVVAAPSTARASNEAGLANLDVLAYGPLVIGLPVLVIVDLVYAFRAEPLPVAWIVTEALVGLMGINAVARVSRVDSDIQLGAALVSSVLLIHALSNVAWSAARSGTTVPGAKPRAGPRGGVALNSDRASIVLAADF